MTSRGSSESNSQKERQRQMNKKKIQDLKARNKDQEGVQILVDYLLELHQEVESLKGSSNGSIPEGSLAELRQEIEGLEAKIIHGPGLCSNGQCAPCKNSRSLYGAQVWNQANKAAMEEIDAACKQEGVTEARNVVAEAVVAYRAKKQGDNGGDGGDGAGDALDSLVGSQEG